MAIPSDTDSENKDRLWTRIRSKFRFLRRSENETNLRETIEELIEESNDTESSIASDERLLLGNVLNLRDLNAEDVMIPRVDIIAIAIDATEDELMQTFIRSRLQRLPVYRSNLDEVVGMILLQDVLAWKMSGKPLHLKTIMREVLFVSPSMRTLDLIFKMRETGTPMAIIVDEFGGVDGLVTFSDLMEEIIGDIQDAQDQPLNRSPQLSKHADGAIISDGKVDLETISEMYDVDLTVEDLEDEVDTVGGLVTSLLGYVPIKGEIIQHPTQHLEFEILDADPRRVKSLLIRPKTA